MLGFGSIDDCVLSSDVICNSNSNTDNSRLNTIIKLYPGYEVH